MFTTKTEIDVKGGFQVLVSAILFLFLVQQTV